MFKEHRERAKQLLKESGLIKPGMTKIKVSMDYETVPFFNFKIAKLRDKEFIELNNSFLYSGSLYLERGDLSTSSREELAKQFETVRLFNYNNKRIGIANAKHTYCIERKRAIIGAGTCKKFAIEFRVNYNSKYDSMPPGYYALIRVPFKLKMGKLYGFRISLGDTRASVSFDRALNNLLSTFGIVKDMVYAISKDTDTDIVKVEDAGSKYPSFSVFFLVPIVVDSNTLDSKITISALRRNPQALEDIFENVYTQLKSGQGIDKSMVKKYNTVETLSAISKAGSLTGNEKKDLALSLAFQATSYLIPGIGQILAIANLAQLAAQVLNGIVGKLEIQNDPANETSIVFVGFSTQNYNYTQIDYFQTPKALLAIASEKLNVKPEDVSNVLSQRTGIDKDYISTVLGLRK
jgi:hypothetical protein